MISEELDHYDTFMIRFMSLEGMEIVVFSASGLEANSPFWGFRPHASRTTETEKFGKPGHAGRA